jgi:hypothetical protein
MWRCRIYDKMTPTQIKERLRRRPEFLRKLSGIIDLFTILDAVFLGCVFSGVVTWITILAIPNVALPVDNTDYFDDVNKQAILSE